VQGPWEGDGRADDRNQGVAGPSLQNQLYIWTKEETAREIFSVRYPDGWHDGVLTRQRPCL
jgi:hypothetical protein